MLVPGRSAWAVTGPILPFEGLRVRRKSFSPALCGLGMARLILRGIYFATFENMLAAMLFPPILSGIGWLWPSTMDYQPVYWTGLFPHLQHCISPRSIPSILVRMQSFGALTL